MKNRKTLSIQLAISSGIIILILLGIIGNFIWIFENRAISGEDVPNHLLFSVEAFYKISDIINSANTAILSKILSIIGLLSAPIPHMNPTYSNLVYLLTSPFYIIFGKTLFTARLSNFTYLIILLLAAYILGKKTGNKLIGLTSMLIISLHPLIFGSLRQFGLDLPLTAITTLTVLLLIASDDLRSFAWAFLIGLCLGIGILIKPQILIFALGPLVYISIRAINRTHSACTKNTVFKIAVIVLLAGIIATNWPVTKIEPGLKTFFSFSWIRTAYNAQDLLYFKDLVFNVIGMPLFIFFLPCTYLFLKKNMRYKYIYLLWIIIPILFFQLSFSLFWFCERFLMPVIPAIAITVSWTLWNLRNIKLRNVLLSLIVIMMSIQFTYLTYIDINTYRSIDYVKNYFWHISKSPLKLFNTTSYNDISFKGDLYKISELLKHVTGKSDPTNKTQILTVLLTPGDPKAFEMRYWFRNHNPDLELIDFSVMFETAYRTMDTLDFIILRLPDKDEFKDWPGYLTFLKLIKKSTDSHSYKRLLSTNLKLKLRHKLYDDIRHQFNLISEVRTKLGFKWLIYKKY
ncbi:ArnT family glycosyltransferase [Elusimicrobiota bacterium]